MTVAQPFLPTLEARKKLDDTYKTKMVPRDWVSALKGSDSKWQKIMHWGPFVSWLHAGRKVLGLDLGKGLTVEVSRDSCWCLDIGCSEGWVLERKSYPEWKPRDLHRFQFIVISVPPRNTGNHLQNSERAGYRVRAVLKGLILHNLLGTQNPEEFCFIIGETKHRGHTALVFF